MKQQSTKGIILDQLIRHKFLTRIQLKKLAREYQFEPDTGTRRLRELCEDFKIKRLNWEGKEAKHSEHIVKWKLVKLPKRSTVFN